MSDNVIVLTIGWTGSSVLTNLISRAGYWVGDETAVTRYNTYENVELVQLNDRLISESGYSGNYEIEFSASAIETIEKLHESIDREPFRNFLAKCSANQPWVWKDPRLWLTIRFWRHLMDLENVRFILLTREDLQSWISCVMKRQILSYQYCRRYSATVNSSIRAFLEENGLTYEQLSFEDVVVRPEQTVAKLNAFLGTSLSLADVQEVYHKPLYRKPRALSDLFKAGAIYVKNWSERVTVGSGRIGLDGERQGVSD